MPRKPTGRPRGRPRGTILHLSDRRLLREMARLIATEQVKMRRHYRAKRPEVMAAAEQVAPREFYPSDVTRLYRAYIRNEPKLLEQVALRRPSARSSLADYLRGLEQTRQLADRIARQQDDWRRLVNRVVTPTRQMQETLEQMTEQQRRLNELAHLLGYGAN